MSLLSILERLYDLTLDFTANDAGYSVVDVTDPDHPQYCFLRCDSSRDTPLSAYQYMSRYNNIVNVAQDISEGEQDPTVIDNCK